MGLRFFADHCVSNEIIHHLRRSGHEVYLLRDHRPTESPDRAVIEKAQDLTGVLISLNGDFAVIVAYLPSQYLGIIALQSSRGHF